MKVLKPNIQSDEIQQWKQFLYELGLYFSPIDDYYDDAFIPAVKAFQRAKGIVIDGIIGNHTWLAAYLDGMTLTNLERKLFPLSPNFGPITSQKNRFESFGHLEYRSHPTLDNPEGIVILNDFERKNIVSIEIPQLAKAFPGQYRSMRFHRKGQAQVLAFFDAIEARGLLPLLLSYGGSYNPRLIRGSRTQLSNHAFGTAFDLNMQWNTLNTEPALLGAIGSLRELVPLAHQFGFYWGGHFSRQDGMHFELAQLL